MSELKKWMVTGNPQARSTSMLSSNVQKYTLYPVKVCKEADNAFNILSLSEDSKIEGYEIMVSEMNLDTGVQFVCIKAQDEINLRYAVSDFNNQYIPFCMDAETHCNGYYYLRRPFLEPLKPWNKTSKPYLKNRGLWTWGHCIYDYRRYIENMVALKLNCLIIWNDYLPVNIKDIIAYAHEWGIRIYLGFAWGWDTHMTDLSKWRDIANSVIGLFREEYRYLDYDGIYFQTFTEHSNNVVDGIIVADAAVQLVNQISEVILKEKPNTAILFGLHATSVMHHIDCLKKLNSNVSIIWEDLGAFPYNYLPERIEGFTKTLALNKKLGNFRSGGFGAVLKGVIALDWNTFEHQAGPFMLGEIPAERLNFPEEKKRIFRYLQARWIVNAHYALEMIRSFKPADFVFCLVEDGYFEKYINLPTALYADMLWNPGKSIENIICDTMLRPDITLL